jgi:hypothetical protein
VVNSSTLLSNSHLGCHEILTTLRARYKCNCHFMEETDSKWISHIETQAQWLQEHMVNTYLFVCVCVRLEIKPRLSQALGSVHIQHEYLSTWLQAWFSSDSKRTQSKLHAVLSLTMIGCFCCFFPETLRRLHFPLEHTFAPSDSLISIF